VNLAHAALAEIDITDGESFINQKDLGIDVNSDREGETNRHAARVCFNGLIYEIADFSEGGDAVIAAVNLFSRKS
jgi:hypothetical protein